MIRVAFQGERGAFSEDAAIKLLGKDIDFLPCAHLRNVFQAVLKDDVSFGIVPIENSQAGSINEAYDLLLTYPLNIFAEVILRISHCLMALPGEKLADIKAVYSHPQALAQCEEFLTRLTTKIVPYYDTAGSAKMIKEKRYKKSAAIAGQRAADIYGLEILAPRIETNINNYTRFVAISREKAKPHEGSKTSLVFSVNHVSGALYKILGIFASRNINLTKLESRPSKSKPWEYIFYVDFEDPIDNEIYRKAIKELHEEAAFVRILGSYPQARQ
ncbi:MAG: prephenate dehydratase [Dehalococcoidia bacterium]|nr:prephenate dehydratase [Dehalococcoidia bacterium]